MIYIYALLIACIAINPLSCSYSLSSSNNRFANFYTSHEATKNFDDKKLTYVMPEYHFIFLFMSIYKSNIHSNKESFLELSNKIINRELSSDKKGLFWLTSKDCNHRLLSYIPTDKNFISLILDQEIKIRMKGFRTEEDEVLYRNKKNSITIDNSNCNDSRYQKSCLYFSSFSANFVTITNWKYLSGEKYTLILDFYDLQKNKNHKNIFNN